MEKLDPEIQKYVKPIDVVLLEISKSSKNLDLTEFSKLVARYNRELNSLLSIYHQNQNIQKKLKPYIMFYRQLFQDLTVLVLSESIDDQQLEKIIEIIAQKPQLIQNYYKPQAEREVEKIGKVSKDLDECLKKRLEREKNPNYYS